MRHTVFLGATALTLVARSVLAAGAEDAPRRAKPPEFPKEVIDVFFEDAREHLVGNRPVNNPTEQPETASSEKQLLPGDQPNWSELIDPDTLLSEIKQVTNSLTEVLSRPGPFKNEGYQTCRRDFSLLAALFGMVEQFDGQVRWQQDATVVKQRLIQAASVCEVGDDESFAHAKQTHSMLIDLIRGQSSADISSAANGQADRAQLMQRMEQAVEESISPSLSSTKVFRRRHRDIAHDSQVLAALARVIQQEGYDYADDEEFVDFARNLLEASVELTRASRERDYEAARNAAGGVTQACSTCHEGFRG